MKSNLEICLAGKTDYTVLDLKKTKQIPKICMNNCSSHYCKQDYMKMNTFVAFEEIQDSMFLDFSAVNLKLKDISVCVKKEHGTVCLSDKLKNWWVFIFICIQSNFCWGHPTHKVQWDSGTQRRRLSAMWQRIFPSLTPGKVCIMEFVGATYFT